MAKIQEQILIIKLSKLVKDDSNSGNVVADTDGLIGTSQTSLEKQPQLLNAMEMGLKKYK